MKRRPSRLLLGLGLLLVVAVPSATAHADLVEARPPPNTRVEEAPQELVLTFSEPLERTYTRVQVVDGNDTHYEQETRFHDDRPATVTVPLDGMPDGIYTVRWRTLSRDTHTLSGSYVLGVNVSLASLPGDPHAGHRPGGHGPAAPGGWPEMAVRATGFAGASLAAGLPLFLLLVARRRDEETQPQRLLLPVAIGGAGLGAAAGLAVAVLIAQRIEAGPLDVFRTASGGWIAWRIGLLLLTGAILAATLTRPNGPRTRGLIAASVTGLAALAATSLSSHAAAQSQGRSLAIAVDALHQAGVAFWVAGVLALYLLMRKRPDPRWMAHTIGRFSPLAVASVALIVATGSFASLQRLEGLDDLTGTSYGQALLLKILLLLPLVILGGFHNFRLRPKILQSDSPYLTGGFRSTLLLEVGIMAVVLAAAGVLSATAPPASLLGHEAEDDLVGLVHSFEENGYNVSLAVHPEPRVGFQHLVLVLRSDTQPLPGNASAFLSLHAPSDSGSEGRLVQMDPIGPGSWEKGGALFTEAGSWRVQIVVQGPHIFLQDSFRLQVAPA